MPPLSVDLVDRENRILLSVTLGPAISLSPVILVDTNLVALDVGLKCGYNAGAFDIWCAELDIIFLDNCKNRIICDLGSNLSVNEVDLDGLPLFCLVLLSKNLYECVHLDTSLKMNLPYRYTDLMQLVPQERGKRCGKTILTNYRSVVFNGVMATRQDILDALLTLGESNGLENVSLSDIANEVGIRKASIYSHFESQQQIIEEAAEYCRRILGSKDFNVDFKAKDARSLLVSLFDSIIKTFAEKPVSSFFSIVQQLFLYDPFFADENRAITSMVTARIRIALEFCVQRNWLDIRDTDYASDLVTAAVMRKICDVLSSETEWETDRLADGLIELFS